MKNFPALKPVQAPKSAPSKKDLAAMEIITYWNSKTDLHPCTEGTKSREEAIVSIKKAIKGSLFTRTDNYYLPDQWIGRPFSVEEIKKSIDLFIYRIKNADAYPADKGALKKTPLARFMKNVYSYSQQGKSWFVLSFTQPPEMVLEDKYPVLSSRLIERYKSEVLGGMSSAGFPSGKDRQLFIKASYRLKDFVHKHNIAAHTHFNCNERNTADWLFSSVVDSASRGDRIVTPAWFCSDLTFNIRLPAYLEKQAIVGNSYFKGRNNG